MDPKYIIQVLEKLKRSGLTSREEVEALKYAALCVRIVEKLSPALYKVLEAKSENDLEVMNVDNEFSVIDFIEFESRES